MQRNMSLMGAGVAALALSGISSVGAEPGEGQMRQRQRDASRRSEVRDRFAGESAGVLRANLPGETNRQFAVRMRAEAAAVEAPTKPKRVRTKKAAA